MICRKNDCMCSRTQVWDTSKLLKFLLQHSEVLHFLLCFFCPEFDPRRTERAGPSSFARASVLWMNKSINWLGSWQFQTNFVQWEHARLVVMDQQAESPAISERHGEILHWKFIFPTHSPTPLQEQIRCTRNEECVQVFFEQTRGLFNREEV